MLSLKDFMPERLPDGWTLLRVATIGSIEFALYSRETDRFTVSMSWEGEAERPHVHMSFSTARRQPSQEEAFEAAKALLPAKWIVGFQMFPQRFDLHKPTVHARVYVQDLPASPS